MSERLYLAITKSFKKNRICVVFSHKKWYNVSICSLRRLLRYMRNHKRGFGDYQYSVTSSGFQWFRWWRIPSK